MENPIGSSFKNDKLDLPQLLNPTFEDLLQTTSLSSLFLAVTITPRLFCMSRSPLTTHFTLCPASSPAGPPTLEGTEDKEGLPQRIQRTSLLLGLST